jgi:glycyl-tRNA synthetase beta chain
MPKNHADFLVEIHTEELPPKALNLLATSFLNEIKKGLAQSQLEFSAAEFFATPRRLAVKVKDLSDKQPDAFVERRGPAWQAAFDTAGQPTPACVGFAKSCDVTIEQLTTIENKQGKWVGVKQTVLGKPIQQLLPTIVTTALAGLPIPKPMRWGSSDVSFVRPVHSVIMLYGNNVIDAEILGCRADRYTQGHRFQCKKTLSIPDPDSYEDILEKQGFVLADFSERKNKIYNEASSLVQRTLGNNARIMIDEKLLDEVTGLVEWPVPILGRFDEVFLNVPQEALISAMQAHQRYFPVVDMRDKLLPYFVTISNIESLNVEQLITGNQRVLRARLSDAAFFYETDKKIKLIDRVEKLASIIFQAKLGSLLDKTHRVVKLASLIAQQLKLDVKHTERAALLAKTDLTTNLVGEFPELQGIAGFYYATNDGEIDVVADAIKESYYPRFSGDGLPTALLSCAVALADRLDTLVGIFGVNLSPTGDKDPYGLRRAVIGVLRILIEKKINLDVRELIKQAYSNFQIALPNPNIINDVWNYLLDRLKPWYQDQAVSADVFSAVSALDISNLYDMHCRIQAVREFKNLPEAESLSIANKRVSNILAQYTKPIQLNEIDNSLFEHASEHELAKQLNQQEKEVAVLVKKANYQAVLTHLAKLREPVDQFFDHVLVMAEDEQCRENRLLMLKKLRELFLQVADVALLQC